MSAALNPMPSADLAGASVDRLDAVASAMERKWGIDRLPKLVDLITVITIACTRVIILTA